jgi:hypothetical protein
VTSQPSPAQHFNIFQRVGSFHDPSGRRVTPIAAKSKPTCSFRVRGSRTPPFLAGYWNFSRASLLPHAGQHGRTIGDIWDSCTQRPCCNDRERPAVRVVWRPCDASRTTCGSTTGQRRCWDT